jgi:hypothetical protein
MELPHIVSIAEKSMSVQTGTVRLAEFRIEEEFSKSEVFGRHYHVPNNVREWTEFFRQYEHLKSVFESIVSDSDLTLGDLRRAFLDTQADKYVLILRDWSENDLIILNRNGFELVADWSALVYAGDVLIRHTGELPDSVKLLVLDDTLAIRLAIDPNGSELTLDFRTRIDNSEGMRVDVEVCLDWA